MGEPTIFEQIADQANKRPQIAELYAGCLREYKAGMPINWGAINQAIRDRWSLSGLEWIKKQAWKQVRP